MRNPLHIPANRFLGIDDLLFFERFKIRHNHRVQLFLLRITRHALQRHHTNFFNELGFQVVRFNLIRIQIFPVRQNNQFLLAPCNKHVAAPVDIP